MYGEPLPPVRVLPFLSQTLCHALIGTLVPSCLVGLHVHTHEQEPLARLVALAPGDVLTQQPQSRSPSPPLAPPRALPLMQGSALTVTMLNDCGRAGSARRRCVVCASWWQRCLPAAVNHSRQREQAGGGCTYVCRGGAVCPAARERGNERGLARSSARGGAACVWLLRRAHARKHTPGGRGGVTEPRPGSAEGNTRAARPIIQKNSSRWLLAGCPRGCQSARRALQVRFVRRGAAGGRAAGGAHRRKAPPARALAARRPRPRKRAVGAEASSGPSRAMRCLGEGVAAAAPSRVQRRQRQPPLAAAENGAARLAPGSGRGLHPLPLARVVAFSGKCDQTRGRAAKARRRPSLCDWV
jgi:hypothetical protein